MEESEIARARAADMKPEPSLGQFIPYTGFAGRTRFENVHLVHANGSCSSVSVCRVVNVQTHPELRDRALSGSLHRLDDGRELALSFVYHDPQAAKFALVLPTSLAHMELKEWSRLMAEIAEDTEHPVPAYVRDNTTVIGWLALRSFIQLDTVHEVPLSASVELYSAELAEREQILAQREHDLTEQEQALRRLADELSARENELMRRLDHLETARVDLELREQELAERGRVRHEAVQLLAAPSWTPVGVANTPVPSGEPAASDGAMEVSVDTPAGGSEEDDAYNTGSHPPPLPVSRYRSAPPPLPLRQRHPSQALLDVDARWDSDGFDSARDAASAPPPLPRHHGPALSFEGLAAAELGPSSRVSSAPPRLPHHHAPAFHSGNGHSVDGLDRSSAPPPLPHQALPVAVDAGALHDPQPEVAPPEHFAALHAGQAIARLETDELWLFAHVDEAQRALFRQGAELWLQYVEVEGYPVALLSLVSHTASADPLRCPLDGRSPSDLRVLEHLSRSFRARIALYSGQTYRETITVAALREGVAQAISERIAQTAQASNAEAPAIGASDALLRVQSAPPPLANDDLPFGPARREASTTATVAASVDQLASWLRPEKLAEATLTYCVPRHVIDASIRRVLRAAVAFGIALPDELIDRAVEHRAARDVVSLVSTQLRGFRQRIAQGENDLGAVATRKNWDRLLALAAQHGVEVDEATRTLATVAPEPKAPRTEGRRAMRPFAVVSIADLRSRLHAPEDRMEAIRELCLRNHLASLDQVLETLRALGPAELPTAMAYVLAYGEAAGDGLIAALNTPEPSLRQLAALSLGRLKLRRALLPLLKQLELETGDIHTELARALGDFGPAALRVLTRALATASPAHAERLVGALAHVANHGAAKEVERLENDADAAVAQAARKAMARRTRLAWEDLAVREGRPLGEDSSAAQLSQAFYAELTKVAI